MGVGEQTIEELLEAIAAPSPTPGGGSVSAICAALSVALSRMVANLAVGKEGYEAVQGELSSLEHRGRQLQARLRQLAAEDAASYAAVVDAMRMPRGTDEERKRRVEAMQAAYRRASETPLETMERSLEALEIAELAARSGNRSATSDAGVAALLAEAALRGAALNVRVNLAALRDVPFRDEAERKLKDILERADKVGHEVMAIVEGRL